MSHAQNIDAAQAMAINEYVDGVVVAALGPVQEQLTTVTGERDQARVDLTTVKAELVTAQTRIRELETPKVEPQPIDNLGQKAGPGCVTLQELGVTTIEEAFTKNGNGKVLSLPPGVFTAPAWNTTKKGRWCQPSSFEGVVGAGVGETILRAGITARPTDAIQSGADGTTNSYHTYQGWDGDTREFGNLTLEGNAGWMHGGARLGSRGTPLHVWPTTLLDAAIGNHWSPPGETFGINIYRALKGVLVEDFNADGKGRASSLLGFNDSFDIQVRKAKLVGAPHGMITFWECHNIETWDVESIGGHHGFNHERNTGFIRHHQPTAIVDRKASPSGMHFTFNNDLSNAGPIEINDPVVDLGLRTGSVMVMTGRNYRGVPNKQSTAPRIFKGGTELAMVDYGTTGTKPAVDPSTYFWMYR